MIHPDSYRRLLKKYFELEKSFIQKRISRQDLYDRMNREYPYAGGQTWQDVVDKHGDEYLAGFQLTT